MRKQQHLLAQAKLRRGRSGARGVAAATSPPLASSLAATSVASAGGAELHHQVHVQRIGGRKFKLLLLEVC